MRRRRRTVTHRSALIILLWCVVRLGVRRWVEWQWLVMATIVVVVLATVLVQSQGGALFERQVKFRMRDS